LFIPRAFFRLVPFGVRGDGKGLEEDVEDGGRGIVERVTEIEASLTVFIGRGGDILALKGGSAFPFVFGDDGGAILTAAMLTLKVARWGSGLIALVIFSVGEWSIS
jgi:hypothetical protein